MIQVYIYAETFRLKLGSNAIDSKESRRVSLTALTISCSVLLMMSSSSEPLVAKSSTGRLYRWTCCSSLWKTSSWLSSRSAAFRSCSDQWTLASRVWRHVTTTYKRRPIHVHRFWVHFEKVLLKKAYFVKKPSLDMIHCVSGFQRSLFVSLSCPFIACFLNLKKNAKVY